MLLLLLLPVICVRGTIDSLHASPTHPFTTVAPALYEGIPQFLDLVKEGLAELAVYSSLYMALVSGLGFSDVRGSEYGQTRLHILNGMYCSMFLHSSVVFLAIFHRVGAMGHLRDSDKLLVTINPSTPSNEYLI